jgi:hypothetical protein
MNGMSKNGQEEKIERLTVKMLLLPRVLFCMQLDNTCGPRSRNAATSGMLRHEQGLWGSRRSIWRKVRRIVT